MRRHLLIASFFVFISITVIFSWFREGYIYGGGDVGLQTYNPARTLENASLIWWEAVGPGFPIPQGLTAVPLQFILSLFQAIGFSPLMLQAGLFFILLFFMGFGMYLFITYKLEEKKGTYPFIGGIFYMFNPYMMIQIWHRFIHTSIILAAALPFLAIHWEKWIREGKFKSLLTFFLINLLIVYAFGTFAYIVTVWIFLLLLTMTALIPWRDKSVLLKIGARFLFGFVIWILINCWWIIPVVKISPAVLSTVHKINESVTTLIAISAQAILPYTLQLINPFYLFQQAELGTIYKSFFFQSIPWVFVMIIFLGLINTFKSNKISLFGILYFISVFFAKGAAPPFGLMFIFGFTNIFALGVMRNPFEKTGLMMVFFASILFVLGINYISERTKHKRLVIGVALSLLLLFAWPKLSGGLTGRFDNPEYVKVPQSYLLTNKWLNGQKKLGISDGKILHLPLTRGEDIKYKWEFGYNGLESSDQFFTSYPSISRGFNMQRVDDSLTALSLIFHKPYYEDGGKILQLLQAFNVRFIVLHRDLNFLGSDVYNPLETEKVLDNLDFIERRIEFGDLVIYQVADQFFGPKIEVRDSVSLIYPQNANMKVWPWLANYGNSFFVSPIQEHNLGSIESSAKSTLIFPKYTFTYPEISKNLDEIKKEFILRFNSMISSVTYLKQQGVIQTNTEETVQNFINASDRLIRIYQAFTSKTPILQSDFDEYVNTIEKILPQLADNSTIYFDISRDSIDDILKYHELLLADLDRQLAPPEKVNIAKARDLIKGILAKKNVLPAFVVLDKTTEFGQREYNKFWINSAGRYELLLSNSKTKDAYANSLKQMDFQINDQEQLLEGKVSGNLISFGEVSLNQGLNEISFAYPVPVNLISSFEDLVKMGDVKLEDGIVQMNVTKGNPAMIESLLHWIGGEDVYQVSFEAQLPTNIILYLQVIQDTDPEENGQKVPKINLPTTQSQPVPDWQSYTTTLPALSLTTRTAKIRLIAVVPEDQDLGSIGKILLRNFRVIRVLNNDIFLRKEDADAVDEASSSGQIVNFEKISPVEYEGEVNLSKAGYIFFKETYHPGWKLQLMQGNKIIEPKGHLLGDLYGNAWYIDNLGEYRFKIIFEPQNNLYLGGFIGGFGVICLSIYGVWFKIIKRNEK